MFKELSDGRQMITMYDGIRYEGVPTRVDYMITKFDEYEGLIGQREVKPKGRDWEAFTDIQSAFQPGSKSES
ncbi:hypothetical protein [Vibrio sp. J502]|uniref:hypothetical protein n=1 Tax=Vibrio sp. J502 TaxID=2978741 RepID=UPI0039656675